MSRGGSLLVHLVPRSPARTVSRVALSVLARYSWRKARNFRGAESGFPGPRSTVNCPRFPAKCSGTSSTCKAGVRRPARPTEEATVHY